MTKEFAPTDDMVTAATLVFQGMALVGTVKPTVTGYKQAILTEMKPRSQFTGEVVTEEERSYQIAEGEFEIYLSKVYQEQKAHPEVVAIVNSVRVAWGLEPIDFEAQPDYCPLLVAEDMLRERRGALIDAMKPVTGIDAQAVLCSGLDNYDKMVDLCLGLLAPFVEDAQGLQKGGGNSVEGRIQGKAGGSLSVVA